MRAWALLLLLPAVQGALLEDAAGDVVISHCEAARTPATGFEAMDLVSLDVNETPDDIVFMVGAAGLEDEADYDSGNYFVHMRRGAEHYALRMFQDNAGTGAIAQVVKTEGISLFGPTIAELPADVDGTAGTISTAVPRDLLIDEDGATPIRGHSLEDLMVSAEAHATGVYFCGPGDDNGAAIILDHAPDSFDPADGARLVFQYGGGSATGPVTLEVERPFRASNGDATTYAFNVTVTNLGETAATYDITTPGLPTGWQFVRPNGTLQVGADASARFVGYAVVPFQHVHGTTSGFDLVLKSQRGDAEASVQLGVHYLAIPQPSGHHPEVHLHSVAALGINTAFDEAAGGGGHPMYWNTLADDGADHGLPMASQTDGGVLVWYGCLAPRLALGLAPATGTSGVFDLTFTSDQAVEGELTGSLRLVEVPERGATCHGARDWPEGETLMTLAPTPVSVSGPTNVEGTIDLTFVQDIPFKRGTDLLLEIRLAAPDAGPLGGAVDLLPGGMLRLPLADHHEPVPAMLHQGDQQGTGGFVEEPTPTGKQSPSLALPLALGALLLAFRRQ